MSSRSTRSPARKAEAVSAPPSTSRSLTSVRVRIACGLPSRVQPSTGAPVVSKARRGERSSSPGRRTSSRGDRRPHRCRGRPGSCRCGARSRWAWARASSPVIHLLSPEASAIRPSIDMASFSVTKGRPEPDPGEEAGHAALGLLAPARPVTTSIPAALQPLDAERRRCADRDRRRAITTRAGLGRDEQSRRRPGPRALSWAQGSSVT